MGKFFSKYWGKRNCLAMAMIGALALVGCGGSSDDVYPIGPGPSPIGSSEESKAILSAVKPITQNADAILGNEVTASIRMALSQNEIFDIKATNGTVAGVSDIGKLVRMVLSIDGGNINKGIGVGNTDKTADRFAVVRFENGVFEKTVYEVLKSQSKTIVVGDYIINGCSAKVEDGVLKSITVSDNAKFTIKENGWDNEKTWYWDPEKQTSGYIYNDTEMYDAIIEGTINGGLSITMNEKALQTINKKYSDWRLTTEISDSELEKLTDYYLVKSKQETETVYTFSNNLSITFTKMEYIDKSGEKKNGNGTMRVDVSNISGKFIKNEIVTNVENWYKSRDWNRDTQEYEFGEWQLVYSSSRADSNDNFDNIKFTEPVKLSINGNLNYDSQTANIKKIEVVVNKVSKLPEDVIAEMRQYDEVKFPYYTEDADVTVEIEANHNYAIDLEKDGQYLLNFNKAVINIKKLHFYDGADQDIRHLNQYRKWNYLPDDIYAQELLKICAASATVHMDATEKDSKLNFTVDLDVPNKTAKVHVDNTMNYNLVDEQDETKVFNFKTADFIGTNVDINVAHFADAILDMEAVEKSGLKTTRRYKVDSNGKLVLVKQNDKEAPVEVFINTTGLPTTTESISQQVPATEDAFNNDTEIKNKSSKNAENGKLQTGEKNGNRVAYYNTSATENDKVKSQIVANKNTQVITVTSVVGNQKYTVVFCVNAKNKTFKGYLFAGVPDNASLEGGDNCIGFFACADGKKLQMTINGNVESVYIQ